MLVAIFMVIWDSLCTSPIQQTDYREYCVLRTPTLHQTRCHPSLTPPVTPPHGQYVIYYNERVPGVIYPYGYQRSFEADLCEVEVYGTCSLSSFTT